MKHFSTIFFFLMLSILLSCETEIPFNGAETNPVLVVNCLACTDSVIQATVSASRFFLSNEYEFPAVTDATVALFVNGIFTENLTHTGLGIYRGNYIPAEGDVVRLNVSATGFKPVWAENAFPIATTGFQVDSTITKTDTIPLVNGNYYNYGGGGGGDYGNPTWDTIGTTFSYIHEYKVRFSNPGGVPNYYRLVVHQQTLANGYPLVNSYLNNFEDLVFGTKTNNLEGIFTESKTDRYNVFSDELIDGKTHTITFAYAQPFYTIIDSSYKSWTVGDERSVTIDLQAISKSYYLYLVSLKALESSDPFMSEPVQIYTNINGGLGILGTRTNKLRKFILPE